MAQPKRVASSVILLLAALAFEAWRQADHWGMVGPEIMRLLSGLSTSLMSPDAAPFLGSSTPNVPLDLAIMEVFATVLLVIKWGLRMCVAGPFMWFSNIPQKVRPKIAQSAVEALFYGSSFAVGFCIVHRQPWVWPSKGWWTGLAKGEHLLLRDDLRCYYILYAARYLQEAVSVVAFDERAKDFLAMTIHHIVTVSVCSVSYVYGCNRIGLVTMVLFDCGDVPMHIAKVVQKSNVDNSWLLEFIAERLWELFAASFILTRCILFLYICWSARFENQSEFPEGKTVAVISCEVFLFILLLLQFYWMSLVVRGAIKKLFYNCRTEDNRSEDSDSDDDKKEQ